MSRRSLALSGGAAALVLLLGVAGAYAYFFSGLRSAPEPLALSAPTPGATAAAGDLAGTWKVAGGSQAEWRVSEVFAGTSSPHQAVGRTSGVSGSVTVQGAAAGNLSFTADLSQLASVDTVAGHDVRQRDQLIRQALGIGQFPSATFQAAQPVTLPDGLTSGQQVQLSVPGELTIHGVTRAVTASVTVQDAGGQVQAAGTIQTDMAAFNITPPSAPFATVDPHVTIGFLLNFAKG